MVISSTSYPNQKNKKGATPNVVLRKFNEILENVKNDVSNDILSWYDACNSIGWRNTKCDYWAEKFPIFGNLKKEIQQSIASKINRGTLTSTFNATGGIWRMKQLGERDERYQENQSNVTVKSIDPIKWVE